ncbi:hypothetical protein HPB52_000775 [Rhipicephalus sanguineus]|uniref:Uncharacterized protein n=1 Tax=Rhipicephalus sanguineus TaxID=34632 RepID=A0A9D4Q0R8_RHISA|nr:hypothetical protein HPB52_000775 [Rhipicephalus sanguineus]
MRKWHTQALMPPTCHQSSSQTLRPSPHIKRRRALRSMISRLDSSHVSTMEALPIRLDDNENSRVFILETLCLTTSRCNKDSTDPITMMWLTSDTTDSSEWQRPVTRLITNLVVVRSGLGTYSSVLSSTPPITQDTIPMFSPPETGTSYDLRTTDLFPRDPRPAHERRCQLRMRGTPGQRAFLRRESLTRSFRLLSEVRPADERTSVFKMAAPNTSGGGMSSAAPPSAAQVRLQAKRPRRCFTTEEDLAILREVAASKPFNDDLQWIHVIENLKGVLGRELTLRSLKDRVDLLIGYWRQEDTKNLRK